MLISTSPKENAPLAATGEALDQKTPLAMEITEMTHSTVTRPQAQEKALLNARRDAAFQRFLRVVLSAKPNQGFCFDRAAVEGFRHA